VSTLLASDAGQPLDPTTRSAMENGFGESLADVRVHTSGAAAESARALGAAAYTAGSDVVFDIGQYRPFEDIGRFVLAHELTHVLQQRQSHLGSTRDVIGRRSDALERGADLAAMAVSSGEPTSVAASGAAPMVQCLKRTDLENRIREVLHGTKAGSQAAVAWLEHPKISNVTHRLQADRTAAGASQALVLALARLQSLWPPSNWSGGSLTVAVSQQCVDCQETLDRLASAYGVDVELLVFPEAGAGAGAKASRLRTTLAKGKLAEQPKEERKAAKPKGATVETYVDNFAHVVYDPDYRLAEGSPTNWMQVKYDDGTSIDINVYSFDERASAKDTRDHLANGKVGDGGRFFPRSLNPYTTPRLWAARQEALDIAAGLTMELMIESFTAVWFVIDVTIGLSGMMFEPPPTAAPRVTRRVVRPGEIGGKPGAKPPAEPAPAPTPAPRQQGRGGRKASVKAANEKAAKTPPQRSLTAEQVAMRDSLLREHPGLHPNVAAKSVEGGARVAGPGGRGADVQLLNGGGREITVHRGAFNADSVGTHLQAEAMQAGTTEIFMQVNSAGATRQGLLKMIPELRSAFVELRGMLVKIFGPNGETWWSGIFRGPK
jgi:hypothetical protein